MQHYSPLMTNPNLNHKKSSLSSNKRQTKDSLQNPSTAISSNLSRLSIQEIHGISSRKSHPVINYPDNQVVSSQQYGNSPSIKTVRKIDTQLDSLTFIPGEIYSQKIILDNIKSFDRKPSVNGKRRSLSCDYTDKKSVFGSREAQFNNPHKQISKIREQRIKKNRKLQELQQKLTLMDKVAQNKWSFRLKHQNMELKKRVNQYSQAVQEFSSYIQSPRWANNNFSQMKEKWYKIIKNVN